MSNANPTGQLVVTGIPGPTLDPGTASRLKRLQPGGFILFSRNIQSATQLRSLIDNLRALCVTEPIITIDQEGGRVSRLRELGNEPPSARDLRERASPTLIERHGELTGRLLRLFGFNLNLCPVLDLGVDENADNSLRGRCLGRDPDETIANARLFNHAMRGEGILSCGKHFPGYTHATVDPHHTLPCVTRSRQEMDASELRVFRSMAREVDCMMSGHAIYPALGESRLPASLSHTILSSLLREEMGFDGLVITDDLDMGAILNDFGIEQAASLALAAGNDILLMCHRIEAVEQAARVLDSLPPHSLDNALERIHHAKSRLVQPDSFSEPKFWRLDKDVWDLRVATVGEDRAARRSPEDGKRSPVELY